MNFKLAKIQELYGSPAAFGIFLIDEDEQTFCAELTPSYFAELLYVSGDLDEDELLRLEETYAGYARYFPVTDVAFGHDCTEVNLDSCDTDEERWETAVEYYRSNHML